VARFASPDERSRHVSKRNMTWLAAVVVIGVLGWLVVGIIVGIVAAALTLVASEVIERRARAQRRAARVTASDTA